jgi:hypothetical protein
MTDAPVESRKWRPARSWGVIILVFAAQLGLILWLGNRFPVTPAPQQPAPVIRTVGPDLSEELALVDPTLFALPHAHGFSGLAWLNIPARAPLFYTWTNLPRWPDLPLEPSGASLHQFVASNHVDPMATTALPASELALPHPPPMQVLPETSSLLLANDLASRRLLTPCALPSITSSNLLTNTVVRLIVDALGRPVSCILLAHSGSAEADDQALTFSRSMRFAPSEETNAADSTAGLTWGEAIFTWHGPFEPLTNPAPKL